MDLRTFLEDWISGGPKKRLERARKRLGHLFESHADQPELLAKHMLKTLRLAVRIDPAQAQSIAEERLNEIAEKDIASAAQDSDEQYFCRAGQKYPDSRPVQEVCLKLLSIWKLDSEAHRCSMQLARLLINERDFDSLPRHLHDSYRKHRLTPKQVSELVHGFIKAGGSFFTDHFQQWFNFYRAMSDEDQPDLCEVHMLMGRIDQAVERAASDGQRRLIADQCIKNKNYNQVLTGLGLASQLNDPARIHALGERFLYLLEAALGEQIAQQEYRSALRALEQLKQDLSKAAPALEPSLTPVLANRKDEVVAVARQDFEKRLNAAVDSEKAGIDRQWSQVEEDAGNFNEALDLARRGNDTERIKRLLRKKGRLGDILVEFPDDDQGPILEESGDFRNAARAYEAEKKWQDASRCYEHAGLFRDAARCLGQINEPIKLARYLDLMEKAGNHKELVDLLLKFRDELTNHSPGVPFLRRVAQGASGLDLLQTPLQQVRDVVARLDNDLQKQFRAELEDLARNSRESIDKRYSKIWGLDLGTSNCAVMIYDTDLGQPVPCGWRDRGYFPSTLAVDKDGREHIGLTLEEALSSQFRGIISASKRQIGKDKKFNLAGVDYEPERVAASFIRHGQTIVEYFLREQVIEKIRSGLKNPVFDNVPEEWWEDIRKRKDVLVKRPEVVVTIPAYFDLAQKSATLQACEIAGVKAVRLIHEPTAACIAATTRDDGRFIVVDLGAGTLDFSYIESEKHSYEVKNVYGDNEFGGNNFDDAIYAYLSDRIRCEHGLTALDKVSSLRLKNAAERLKIDLSTAESAHYHLTRFEQAGDIQLELTRENLNHIIAPSLVLLKEKCREFLTRMEATDGCRLILVGGPMLAPWIREGIREVFKLPQVLPMTDYRAPVATGAAMMGALLSGDLRETVVVDVVPHPLGISAIRDEDGDGDVPGPVKVFDELIGANTIIPVKKTKIYTTIEDNQNSVTISAYRGTLADENLIGRFNLNGIPNLKAGVPQIEVTFDINKSCELLVTAKMKGEGISGELRVDNVTLISPERMKRLRELILSQEREKSRLRELYVIRHSIERVLGSYTQLQTLATEWCDLCRDFDPRKLNLEPRRPEVDDLKKMFQNQTEIKQDIDKLQALLTKASHFIDTIRQLADDDLQARIVKGYALRQQLDKHSQEVTRLMNTLRRFNNLLSQVASEDPNPIRRLEAIHKAGDHERVIREFESNLSDIPLNLVERYVDSLAHHKETFQAYKDSITCLPKKLPEKLRFQFIDWSRMDDWCGRVRPAVAFVKLRQNSNTIASGSGFLVSPDAVVTCFHVVKEALAKDCRVFVGNRDREITEILTMNDEADIAVLRLRESVGEMDATPFRCGQEQKVEVGQNVVGLGFPYPDLAQEPQHSFMLREGRVQSLFPSDEKHPVLRIGVDLQLGHGDSGGPLVNELGEVVGILAGAEVRGENFQIPFAISIDPLRQLIGPPWRPVG